MNLNLQNLSGRTVTVADYRTINANLAKVIIATTGDVEQEDIEEAIIAKLKGQGALVKASLRKVTSEGSIKASYVGFIRAMNEVREVTPHELQASYKAIVASNENVLINNKDQSVWQLKTAASGKYLVRQSEDDLQSLVASVVNNYVPAPKLSAVRMPMPECNQLAAYVTPEGTLDYGFVTRTSTANNAIQVVSSNDRVTRTVNLDVVASAYSVEIPTEVYKVAAANVSREEKDKQIAFYTSLYDWAPDYLADLIKDIESS